MAFTMRHFEGILRVGTRYRNFKQINVTRICVLDFSAKADPAHNDEEEPRVPTPKGDGKLFTYMSTVVSDIPNDARLLIGGFGLSGIPGKLIKATLKKGSKDLTGTLAESIRAGGAGIPAFHTPTGVGTIIQEDNYKYDSAGNAEISGEPRSV